MARHSIYAVLISMMILIGIGIVMLFSTGAFAHDSRGDMYFFVKRQSMWLVVGMAACVAGALIDYQWWRKTWGLVFAVAVVLLILCFIPPIGMKINGSWRWLNLGFMAFQPSELAKIASVFFLAWWFTKYEKKTKSLFMGFVAPGAVVSILLALIAGEVDLGTTALIGAVMFAVMFVAGTSLLWLVPLVLAGFGAVIYVALNIEQRTARLLAFLNPEQYRLSEGLQQWQALIAFGSGGFDGLGLGEGRQKMLYLPYAHTDFIFPMIGEELGLRFTLMVVFCFLLLCLAGCLVASQSKDRFGMLLGFGLVLTITLQAVVNIGVTTSLFPNKGMPLPFISYGGSNLVICMFMIGILINIHRHIPPPPLENEGPALDYRPAMRW
jgi:cell division protein FtsW